MKFREKLANLILQGKKNTTWRLFNDKNLSQGDIINFIVWETNEEFAKVKLTSVKGTTFKELTDEDKEGHEEFSSDKEMYATYSTYYQKQVTPETKLKIIKFQLIK